MKLLSLFLISSAVLAGCGLANDPIIISSAPVITRLSPDTVWTTGQLRIEGKNFGYDNRDVPVRVDTGLAPFF